MEEVRSWIAADESAAAMLARAQLERPLLVLPPPLHRAPLRVGNVVELAGPSPSAKSQVLLQAAVICILPKEWNGVHFGGLERAVAYFDLDCRFDVLRLAQVLRSRIVAGILELNHSSSQETYSEGSQKYATFNVENFQIDEELFLVCMRRFLYVRCNTSLEFLAALKSMLYRFPKESKTSGSGIHFVMIDSIGAFYWVDRAYKPLPLGEQRKKFSLQTLTEAVVDEIRRLLQVHPVLVLATKATIFGSGIAQSDAQRHDSKWPLDDVANTRTSSKEPSGKLSYREYMPSIWQSFVTHRLHLELSDEIVADAKHGNVPAYTSKWIQPPIDILDRFAVRDDGIVMLS